MNVHQGSVLRGTQRIHGADGGTLRVHGLLESKMDSSSSVVATFQADGENGATIDGMRLDVHSPKTNTTLVSDALPRIAANEREILNDGVAIAENRQSIGSVSVLAKDNKDKLDHIRLDKVRDWSPIDPDDARREAYCTSPEAPAA